MLHVFISYKRNDLDRVEPVVDELKRHHYVWFDKTGIPGGSQWENRIDEAINKASALVLMVTPAAIESDWVTYEYKTALDKGKTVIPLLLEPTTFKDGDILPDIQMIDFEAPDYFEQLLDAMPDESRIWGMALVPENELQPDRTYEEIAKAYPDGLLRPQSHLIGLPIKQTRYCKIYRVGKSKDTLIPRDNYQIGLQLTSREFSLNANPDGSYPQDDFMNGIAGHFLTSPAKHLQLYLIRGPLNQPYDNSERLGFGLNTRRGSEWQDVIQAADYARGRSRSSRMQLFVNGPAILTYKFGTSNPGFGRYELYQLEYSTQQYFCVLSG